MTFKAVVIGTGAKDGDGFAMGYSHADGYSGRDDCELVAGVDLVRENAEAFAEEYGLGEDGVFEDHETMLATVEPDVVSICVPPAAHTPLVIDCAEAGVDAIHCEKPMADTWGAAKRMAEAARENDVQLTFNHQRRFGTEWQRAKELLDEGEIGDLQRIETAAPDLFDWGTHCLDLCGMFVDDASPEWTLGAVHVADGEKKFGVYHEDQTFALWEYENGVFGMASTGGEGGWVDCGAVDALHRLRGTDGVMEVNPRWGEDGALRIRRAGDADWEVVVPNNPDEDVSLTARSIDQVIEALAVGHEPAHSARRALDATELIFGIYESSRRRGRVEFPLEIDDHPLEDLVSRREVVEPESVQ